MRTAPRAIYAALLATLLLLSGCSERERLRKDEQAKTANLAAGLFELAVAMEAGVEPAAVIPALKLGAAAIIKVNGSTYQPADDWVKKQSAPPAPEGK